MERDALLTAIAKARAWIEDPTEGRVTSFADIAKREEKVERHIRLLAPLAFVSPSLVADIVDGAAPVSLNSWIIAGHNNGTAARIDACNLKVCTLVQFARS